jgi:chemotaxis protein CheX
MLSYGDRMKEEYIDPFINATRKLMEMMVGIKDFRKKEVSVDQQMNVVCDVSAIIGVTGDCTGSIVLSFTNSVATKMLSKLLGEPVKEFNDDVCDAVCEMVNIIAGNASAELNEKRVGRMERSLPNVIYGNGHAIKSPQHAPVVNLVFETELGDFALQVSLKFN